MKIVIVGTAYPLRGGIAHYNALLYRALRARGHQVHVVSFKRQYPSLLFPGRTQQDAGEEAIPIQAEPLLDSIGPASWLRVALRIRQHAPDLVLFKYWMPFFAPCFAAVAFLSKLLCPTPVVYICDNIVPHEGTPLDVPLTRLGLGFVDHFVVMSHTVRQDLLRFVPHADFRQVPHPVYSIFGDPLPKEEARRRLGLGNGNLVLFFGYVRAYKGLHVLLKAMPEVLRQIPVRLLVAGEFYSDKSSYMELIEQLGISSAVTVVDEFIPNQDVKLYYSAADVVVLPYLAATQSGIVQIAYHFNKPVITTEVGGLPDEVVHGATGFVVPADDPQALAKAIVSYFAEKRERDFAEKIALHKGRYSWDRLAEAIESFATP
ncbi:MAG: glycosyltransferase [bacterium]|jgi:glycosyltransferase involved in cell wall biosynthesis|nr:glycosyltransferase [candidate division KSB1 bacterium]MDH7561549.1 glycosyltransferase [bacterium]